MGRGHEGGTLTHIYSTPLHMVDQKPNGHVCRIDAARVIGLKPRPTRQKELETFFNT